MTAQRNCVIMLAAAIACGAGATALAEQPDVRNWGVLDKVSPSKFEMPQTIASISRFVAAAGRSPFGEASC